MSTRWVSLGQGLLGGLLTILGLAAPLAAQRVSEVSPLVISVFAVILVTTGVLTLLSVFKARLFTAIVAPGVGFTVAFLFVAIVVFPMVNKVKSGRRFAGIIASHTADSRAAGHRVMAFDLGNLPIHYAFYSDGIYTIETKKTSDLAAHLDRDEEVWAVVNLKRLGELPPEIQRRIRVVDSTKASRRHVGLLTNRAPPE